MNEEAEDRKPECRNNVGRCRSYLGLMLQFGPEYNDKREWMQEKPAIVAHVNRKRIFFCWHAHKIGEQRYDRERPDLSMLHQQFLDAIAQQKIWVLTGDELLEAHCAVIRREIEWALTTIERKEQEIFEWQQKLAALEDEKWGAR